MDELGRLTITEKDTSLPDLPDDIFIQVVTYLEAWDVVRCRKVSRRWREAFSHHEYLRHVLKKYPLARGVNDLIDCDGGAATESQKLFDVVASRYYHLSHGTPKDIVCYKLLPLEQYSSWYPIGQWDYHESQPGGRLYYENAATHLSRLGNKPYLFRPTLWSYDDGLLACALQTGSESAENNGNVLSVLDVESGKSISVPFGKSGKIVRNITFRNRALVIEWAEKDPYHALNDNERVHRHFATCFDVSLEDGQLAVTFRNEWKMHFLGIPLNTRDRFFSTHNGTHYAVYFWQPNRSMYTGDEDMPIEALFVWDISTACPYRPSTDPTGKAVPTEDKRPHMLARFSFRELDFIGVRQHSNVSLMSLQLISESNSLVIRENVYIAGQGYFDPAERLMQTTTTTFPFVGEGPARRHEWDRDYPPYRGHCSMESTDVLDLERWFLPVMDVYDDVADVRLSLVETCFTGQSMENRLMLRVRSRDKWCVLDDAIVKRVAGMGRIAGDERWVIGQNGQMEIVIVKF